jgi:hypothetical protein
LQEVLGGRVRGDHRGDAVHVPAPLVRFHPWCALTRCSDRRTVERRPGRTAATISCTAMIAGGH